MKDIKNTTAKLVRKNERLKCKLSQVRRQRITTVVSIAAFIAVGFVVELCFNQVKSRTTPGGSD